MDLKIKDIIGYLQVSEKTVYRWIKDKKIPCYRINHQYRFNRAEINEWILNSKIELASKLLDLTIANRPTNFTNLLRNGGIHYDIPGQTVKEILHHAIEAAQTPAHIAKEKIFTALLDREELMSTAIGRGIAIPHPRNPIITDIEDASVSLCFLKDPVDFGALDAQPVHTLFLLLTYSPRRHLEVLTKITYLCQSEEFLQILTKRTPAEDILSYIQQKEREWHQKESRN